MFASPLKLVSIRGTNSFELTDVLILFYVLDDRLREIRVPAGTRTDFASIPSFLRNVIDNDEGDIRDAAVVHDYLYSTKSTTTYPEITRAGADFILSEAMKCLRAPLWKRRLVYYAVRMFGWVFYKQDK